MDPTTGAPWQRLPLDGPGRLFEPRRPLRRDVCEVVNDRPLVLRVPPNSPALTVDPLANQPASNPAPSTPMWQMDGLDHPAFQPDPEIVVPQATEAQGGPAPAPEGGLGVLQQVGCSSYVC